MMRMLVFVCAVTILEIAAYEVSVINHTDVINDDVEIVVRLLPRQDLRRKPVKGSNSTRNGTRSGTRAICTDFDAQMYSHDFHHCFMDRKYKDGGRDLENIVDRILEHSGICIQNSSRNCTPNYNGFMVIMDRVIYQMKDYTGIYLELISHGRNKIKDLDCVETSLSNQTYQSCFQDVFVKENLSSEKKFQQKVEKAITCTNKSHKQCSRAAKTSLNRMVRTILGVRQPQKEDIEDEKPPKPWRWYDYIIQPIVRAWNSIRSFFGF